MVPPTSTAAAAASVRSLTAQSPALEEADSFAKALTSSDAAANLVDDVRQLTDRAVGHLKMAAVAADFSFKKPGSPGAGP